MGGPPASLVASSLSGQVSLRFLPLTLGWFHQCTTASEAVCYRKLCCRRLPHLLGAMVESADKEKRPVKFMVAGANQKCGSLRAGFLCEGECCQESCGESRGLLFRGKSYLLLLAVVSVQALASGREKLCISLSCDVAQEKWLKVRITVVFLDKCCRPLLCLPIPAWFFICCRKGGCTEGCLMVSSASLFHLMRCLW